MLLEQNNHKALMGVLFTCLLTLLASCSNSAAIESLVSADPQLKAATLGNKSPASKPRDAQKASYTEDGTLEKSQENSQDRDKAAVSNDVNDVLEVDKQPKSIDLPENFPASFPIYTEARLKDVKLKNTKAGMLTWNIPDKQKAIADYYQAELIANDWKIIKPFNLKKNQTSATAIAKKNKLQVDLTLFPSVANPEKDGNSTKLTVNYQPLNQASEDVKISGTTNSTEEPQPATSQSKSNHQLSFNPNEQPPKSEPELKPEVAVEEQTSSIPSTDYLDSLTAAFVDLDEVPEQFRQPLEEVATLGILTPYTGEGNIELSKFAPNQIITRGEYARWLIAANNQYYKNNPGKKIYIANKTNQPAFQDIQADHPDFGAIQGLAEAGLVPSRLTDDSTNLLFRPDAPLTREDLIVWKVPFDMRKALPKASIKAIEESWGFQDAADIDSAGIRALYADFQNGDRSNVRRIFGYTTLFQPKKPVTRAEAAVSLWYFGYQGEGITGSEILETETESNISQ